MPSVHSPDGDDIGYGPGNTSAIQKQQNTGINGGPNNYAGPSNHDYNQANGMTREQYRDAWMNSGVNTIQGQQDWLAKYGGQIMSGNGTAMTPYGDVLDMQIGARTGNGRPGWTTVGNSKPSDFFNQQMDLSQDMSKAQGGTMGTGNGYSAQPQTFYAGSQPPVDRRNMLNGTGSVGPINSGTASPSSSFYAPAGPQDINAGFNPMNKSSMIGGGMPIDAENSIPNAQPRTRLGYAAPSTRVY